MTLRCIGRPFSLVHVTCYIKLNSKRIRDVQTCLVDGSSLCPQFAFYHFFYYMLFAVATSFVLLIEIDSSCSHQVFLATDIDGVPIICFLLHEQKTLLAVRIHVDETNEETFGDIKPHMSWNIPAFAAAPDVVTRPR